MSSNNREVLSGMLSIILSISHFGCGSRPAPVITVGVSSTAFTSPTIVQVGATAQFYATVTGDPQGAGVNWTLTCPTTSCGSISPTSTANQFSTTYVPPANLPESNLTVTIDAASATEPAAKGSITIIVPSVVVTLAPNPATVPPDEETQFTATVSGDSTNAGVTWILAVCQSHGFGQQVCDLPPTCECGIISATNSVSGSPITYTAPLSQFSGGLTLTATSVANPFAVTTAPITVSSSSNSSANANDPAPRDFHAGILNQLTLEHSFGSDESTTQSRAEPSRKVHYKVTNLGTLGGSFAEGNGISDRGWVSGFSTLPGDQSTHATLWTEDAGLQDLGTLGGPNSSISFPVKDSRGLLVGGTDTSSLDPFSEGICAGAAAPFTTSDPYVCRGFLWRKGTMTPLSTLGGNNSFAENVNDMGQIVGFAETANPDPNCIAPQVFDLNPVVWEKEDLIVPLPQLPGDVFGAAIGINDSGQIVGVSSQFCAPGSVVTTIESHIVLWEKGVPINLGGLGGVANNFPFAINNRGDIAGVSDVTGDTASHAFLWTKGKGMQDLGTLPGDISSVVLGMNNKGQLVGGSADANGNGSAFLWEDGVMTDLNTLVCGGSSLFLDFAGDINDQGEISGQAIDPTTGALVGFLAIPTHDEADYQANPPAGQKISLPENTREQIQRRFGLTPTTGEILFKSSK